jgi:hypothetical protein
VKHVAEEIRAAPDAALVEERLQKLERECPLLPSP